MSRRNHRYTRVFKLPDTPRRIATRVLHTKQRYTRVPRPCCMPGVSPRVSNTRTAVVTRVSYNYVTHQEHPRTRVTQKCHYTRVPHTWSIATRV